MDGMTQLADAINKAVQLSTNAPVSIQVEKDTDIQSRTVKEQTFLEFLELKNRTRDVTSNYVEFYEETGGSNAAFIPEAGPIPEFTATTLTPVSDSTKTLAIPVQISMKAQDGTNDVNLREYLIRDSYVKINNLMDKTLLQGNKTTDANSFDAITTGVTAISNEDATITEKAIKGAIQTCVRAGGHPDCLVTTPEIANQIDALVSPFLRYNNVTEIALGHTVSTFKSTDGSFIPILVDNNVPEGQLCVLDTTGIDVAYQRRPSIIQLAQTTLATNEAIYCWATAYNKAKFKSRVITDIAPAE